MDTLLCQVRHTDVAPLSLFVLFISSTPHPRLLLLRDLQGAEVVRMYYTLLGVEGFARGLRSFFDTHDLQVRCEATTGHIYTHSTQRTGWLSLKQAVGTLGATCVCHVRYIGLPATLALRIRLPSRLEVPAMPQRCVFAMQNCRHALQQYHSFNSCAISACICPACSLLLSMSCTPHWQQPAQAPT